MAPKNKSNESTAMTTTDQPKALTTPNYGGYMTKVGEGVAQGYEHQTQEDASVPWIVLLQPGTPLVVEKKVPGAEAGLFLNTVTGKLYKEVVFLPGTTRHEFVEWVPRNKGGGIVARHAIDSDVVKQAKSESKSFGEYYVGENELVETFYIYGALDDGEGGSDGPCVIAFTSSKIKPYKDYIAQIRAHTIEIEGQKFQPPMFAHVAKMTAEGPIKHTDGSMYYKPALKPVNGAAKNSLVADPDNDERFKMAALFKDMVDRGVAKVDYEKQEAGAGRSGGAGGDSPF